MMSFITKHLSIALLRYKFDWYKLSEYKLHFWLRLVSLFGFSFFHIVFWFIILGKIKVLEGWTLYALAMIAIFGRFSGAFFWGLFSGFHEMSDDIREGNLTMHLTKPVSVLFMLLSKKANIMTIADLLLGIILIFLTAAYFHETVGLIRLLQSIIISVIGSLLFAVFVGIFACLAFWITEVEKIVDIFISFKSMDGQPLTIFPNAIQAIVTLVIPLIYIKVYPALILTGNPTTEFWPVFVQSICLLLILFTIFYVVWRLGLKRYEAVGG